MSALFDFHKVWGYVAISANAIMGLEDEWEEVAHHDLPVLAAQIGEGQEIRLLRRRSP